MELTWPVVFAVLLGAMLHASWNAMVKSSSDKSLDTALINLLASFLAIPLVVWFGWPQAQAWLRFKGYQPAVMRIGAMTRLGARVGMANVAFDDHPNEQRYAGRIETVTVESMLDWLPRAGLGSAPQRLSL